MRNQMQCVVTLLFSLAYAPGGMKSAQAIVRGMVVVIVSFQGINRCGQIQEAAYRIRTPPRRVYILRQGPSLESKARYTGQYSAQGLCTERFGFIRRIEPGRPLGHKQTA